MGHDGVEWVQYKKVESMDERWRAAGGEEHVAALHAIHMSGPQLFAFGQDFRKDGWSDGRMGGMKCHSCMSFCVVCK